MYRSGTGLCFHMRQLYIVFIASFFDLTFDCGDAQVHLYMYIVYRCDAILNARPYSKRIRSIHYTHITTTTNRSHGHYISCSRQRGPRTKNILCIHIYKIRIVYLVYIVEYIVYNTVR